MGTCLIRKVRNLEISELSFSGMAKRARDVLTGGSGDVNPQTMVISTGNVAGVAVQQTVSGLPIPRLPIKEGKSLVMEITDIKFASTGVAAAVGVATTYAMFLTTDPTQNGLTLENMINNPRTIAEWMFQTTVAAAPTSFETIQLTYKEDMTDAAGHGFLVATDNLFMNVVVNQAGSQLLKPTCTISYRFKEVSLQEYIGIVQSQQ